MNKMQIMSILVLIVVGYIVFSYQQNTTTTKSTTLPKVTETPISNTLAETTFFLLPNVSWIDKKDFNSISEKIIKLSTGRNKVTSVHMDLSYDPKFIRIVDIVPLSFFDNPVIKKEINEKEGKVTFVIGTGSDTVGKSGKEDVAKILFQPIGGDKLIGHMTAIKVLRTSKALAVGNSESVLRLANGANIHFFPPVTLTAPTRVSDSPTK
jgi:hypothetical protein